MRCNSSLVAIGLVAAGFLLLIAFGNACRAADAPAAGSFAAPLVKIGAGAASISVASPTGANALDLSVADRDTRTKLLLAQPGDIVTIEVDNAVNPRVITQMNKLSRPVSARARIIAIAGAILVLVLVATLVTRWRPQSFLIGLDNRYSNSQCQLALWFGAVATMYAAAVWLRLIFLGWDFVGGVGLTQNLVVLTGLSAFTFGGAKVITGQKVDAAAAAGQPAAKQSTVPPNLLTDLVQNDKNQADLGDFQMILVTLVAVAIFVLSAFHFLGSLELTQQVWLPDIDSTLLSGFGLGQGAYLVKKAASKLGEG
jgi:hypothetical protein